ncbi:hypothetical protein CXF82_00945, partial [Shewanella sp. GutDb-MelDb]
MKKIINGLVASVAFACSFPVMASSHTIVADYDKDDLLYQEQAINLAGIPNVKFKPLQTAGIPNVKFKPLQTAGIPNVKFKPLQTAGIPNVK